MKKLILCIAALWVFANAELPQAPKMLLSIHIDLGELEEAYIDGKWAEAKSQLMKVRRTYAKLLKDLLNAVPKDVVASFGKTGAKIDKAIEAKDKAKIAKDVEELNVLFIKFMEHFSHERAPVLIFIEAQCKEIIEGRGAGYEGEVSELERYTKSLEVVLSESDLLTYKNFVKELKAGNKSKAKELQKFLATKK